MSDFGGCSDSYNFQVNMVSLDELRGSETLEDVQSSCDEFSLDSCGSSSGISSYSLHTLFQLDDLDHFSDCVFNEYGLRLYDVDDKCSTGHGLKRLGAMSYNPTAVKDVSHVQCFDDALNVRAASVCRCSEIILDSGSDVTLIPSRMAGSGTKVSPQPETYLRDAQGKQIKTCDVRDVSFSFQTLDGSIVNVKERAFFSDRVESPLISFGKLVKAGWGIQQGPTGRPVLAHPSGACVDIAFRNNSILISGTVRMVQDVRTIGVDLPRAWQGLRSGWFSTDEFEICSSGGSHFIDATIDYLVTEWPFRTTVGYNDARGWEVIELCERLFTMDERAAPVRGNYQKLLTILSKKVIPIAEFGMVTRDFPNSGASGSGDPGASQPSAAADVPMQQEPNGGAIQSQREDAGVEIPQSIAIQPSRSNVKIAGVDVSNNSSSAVLKAACEYLQVSQSGSKQKLWNRMNVNWLQWP